MGRAALQRRDRRRTNEPIEPQFGRTHSHAEVAQVLGVPVSELDENLPIQTVSTGLPFTMVPFRSLETLQKLEVAWHQLAAGGPRNHPEGIPPAEVTLALHCYESMITRPVLS